MSGGPVAVPDLREVTAEVWQSLVDTGGDPGGGRLRTVRHPHRPTGVSATVAVSGGWHGSIMVSCPPVAAQRLAAAMLAVPQAAVTRRDVDDALGELANIIGGNVKGLLPGPSKLSLPTLARWADDHTPWHDGERSCQLSVDWHGEQVLVTVLSDDPRDAAELRHTADPAGDEGRPT